MSRIQNPFSAFLTPGNAQVATVKPVVADDVVDAIESAKINIVSNPNRFSELIGETYRIAHIN